MGTKGPVAVGTAEIVWNSVESMDFPIITISITGSAEYSGCVQ